MPETTLYQQQYDEMMEHFKTRQTARKAENNYNVEAIIDYIIKFADQLKIGNDICIDCVQIAENAIFYSENANYCLGEFDLGNWVIHSKEGDHLPDLTTEQEQYINNKIQKFLNN